MTKRTDRSLNLHDESLLGAEYEDIDEKKFRLAICYAVAVYKGVGHREVQVFKTFPEALVTARDTPRSMLYAELADDGNGANLIIPRAQWQKYLDLYNDLTAPYTGVRIKIDLSSVFINPKSARW